MSDNNNAKILCAMTRCVLFPQSSVIFICTNMHEINKLMSLTLDICNEYIPQFILEVQRQQITFINMSYILFKTISLQAEQVPRGFRASLPMYDDAAFINNR